MLEELEEKNLLYKLKRWEKNILNYLRSLFYKDEKINEHMKIMEKQKQVFNEELQKENDNYIKTSKEMEQEKEKKISLIDDEKNKVIKENNKKYNDLFIFSIFDTISIYFF